MSPSWVESIASDETKARWSEGAAGGIALLGFIVAPPMLVGGHGTAALAVLIAALVLSGIIYYGSLRRQLKGTALGGGVKDPR